MLLLPYLSSHDFYPITFQYFWNKLYDCRLLLAVTNGKHDLFLMIHPAESYTNSCHPPIFVTYNSSQKMLKYFLDGSDKYDHSHFLFKTLFSFGQSLVFSHRHDRSWIEQKRTFQASLWRKSTWMGADHMTLFF